MFGRNKRKIPVPDQSFVRDVDLEVSLSHPLRTKKMLRIIVYCLIGALCIAGGVVGIRKPFDNVDQQSANIAASCLFFVVGVLLLVLMFLTYKSKVVVKEVKSTIVAVWAGIRKNTVYLGTKLVYKGRNDVIRVTAGNKIIIVNVVRNVIYFE